MIGVISTEYVHGDPLVNIKFKEQEILGSNVELAVI
tara:strand:- start:60 stop:167 length:108 start_codon:yes stop_codon:yes gene_type:complete